MRQFLFLATLLVIAGCAVLKIDVDVYKGPLSNHEEVQQQQLAVMAIAAKPLLLGLRNDLEWSGDKHNLRLAKYSDDDREKIWSGWVDYDHYHYTFSYALAERANAVLYLYQDVADKTLADSVKRISELASRYRAAWFALRRNSLDAEQADAAAWQKILAGLKDPPHADDGGAFVTFLREKKKKDTTAHWSESCEPAFTKNAFTETDLIISFRVFIDASYTKETFDGGSKKRPTVYNSDGLRWALNCQSVGARPTDHSYNALFEFLADEKNIGSYAQILFRDANGDAAKTFIRKVNAVAQAFLDVRSAFDGLIRASLEALIALDDASPDKGALPRQRELFEFDRKHPAFRRGLGHLVTEVMDLDRLFFATCLDLPSFGDRKNLRTSVVDPLPPELRHLSTLSNAKREEIYIRAGRDIEAMLLKHPGAIGRLILGAHIALKEVKPGTAYSGECESTREGSLTMLEPKEVGEEFKFGLARGPTSELEVALSDVTKTAESVAEGAALGFDRGRLAQGLESLIENYIADFAVCRDRRTSEIAPLLKQNDEQSLHEKCNREEWDTLRQNLGDELVHFAQKILFVANYQDLLNNEASSGPYSTTTTSQNIREYQLVLQAVGNSILDQLDELKFRREHKTRLLNQAKGEFETLKKANTLNPQAVVEDMVHQLRAKATAVGAAKAAGDDGSAGDDPEKALASATDAQKQAQAAVDNAKKAAAPVYAAYSTLIGEATDADASAADKIALQADKAALETSLGLGDAQVKASDLLNQIIAWLQRQFDAYDDASRDNPRAKRLDAARGYLDGRRSELGPAISDTRTKTFATMKTNLGLNKSVQDDKVKAAQDALTAAQKTLKVKTDEVKAAHLKLAADTIEACRAVVAKQSSLGKQSPVDVFATMKAVLVGSDSCVKNKDGTAKPGAQYAVAALGELKPPLGESRIYDADPAPYEDARDVLDREIKALEYERIRARQEGGDSSAYAQQIESAIAAAHDYRAGMAYIRPSGAYLRSSYPATALQDDPNLGWSNLLGDASLKSVPIFGRFFVNKEDDLKIQSAIDKQFWQNVNSVRVTGGGTTNYVIAKDDIGNWYVKAYSGDPQPIIEGAQSLAAFGLGAKLPGGAQLPKVPTTPSAGSEQAAGGAGQATQSGAAQPTTSSSPLEKLLNLHKTKYETQTAADYARLGRELTPDQITQTIKAALGSDKNPKVSDNADPIISTDLAAAKKTLDQDWQPLTDSSKATTKPDEQAARLVDALNALLRYRNAAATAIRNSKTITADDDRKAAVADLDSVMGPLLTKNLAGREAAVKDYSGIVTEIGQVAQ